MIYTISGDPIYLIEGAPNQTHQANIYYIREPSDPDLFYVNITIWPLHTNTSQNKSATTIGFGTHCHTPATNTVFPASPIDPHLQHIFQPNITGFQFIADSATDDTPLLAKNGCDPSNFFSSYAT